MARTVSVSKLKQMQRQNAQTGAASRPGFSSPAQSVPDQLRSLVLEDDIAGMPLGQVVGLVRLAVADAHVAATESEIRDEAERRRLESAEAAASLGTGYGLEEPADEPTMPDAMTRLVARELTALDVGAACSEEMSLGMVVDRVRDAVLATDWGELATEAEIVAEAERIWEGFSVNRKGPREYDLNADGTIRDWRRPATTPDRGDVTATHTIGDDDQRRFSGAGASGDMQQATLFLVPSDADFNGRPYREAPELAMLAADLMEKHGYLAHLEHCTIRYFWERKTGSVDRQRVVGSIKRGSGHYGDLLRAEFAIFLAADTAREGNHSDRRVERSLFRQLRQIGQDDKGNWIKLPYSLKLFPEEIQEYADLNDADLKVGRNAYRNAEQMGLFSEDDAAAEEYGSDGLGAGVLIHDDGRPLTADEIEAMHGRELADEPFTPGPFAGADDDDAALNAVEEALGVDTPADPDGPLPEDEDILADPKVI